MEALVGRRFDRGPQHPEIAGQRVDIEDVEIFSGGAEQHFEAGAPCRHEVTDHQRVGAALVDALAVSEPRARDALIRCFARVVPDLHAGDVTIRQVIATSDAMLERVEQHVAFDRELE